MVPINNSGKIHESFTKKMIKLYQPYPHHTNMNRGVTPWLPHLHLETVWWGPVKCSCPTLNKYLENVEKKGLGRGWRGGYPRTKIAEEKDS